jgi:hypothetical protein
MPNPIVVPDVAIQRLTETLILGDFSPIDGNATLHLLGNEPSLDEATDLTDFVELVLDGYTPIELSGATDEGIDSDHRDGWQWPTLNVTAASTPGSPVTAYGYYVTSDDDGALLWCQLFDVSFTWATIGDTMSLTPVFYGAAIGS